VTPHSRPDQIRQAIRAAMTNEPLWVRVLAYRFREAASDEALEKLLRLLK
jgi:hypothetical protein